MKIWIKLLGGGAVGLLLGLLLPVRSPAVTDTLSFLSELIISIGRYAIYPMVFLSLAVGTFELRRENKILRVYGRAIAYMVVTGLLLSLIGTASVVLMAPDRIPIVIEEEIVFSPPSVREILRLIFPRNYFQVLNDGGDFLAPLCFLSFFLGLNFSFDRLITRPAVQLFDSLSRIFYHINSFIMEILGAGMIGVAAFLTIRVRAIPEIELYRQLIIVLSIDAAVVLLGIFPLILYYALGKKNPYRWMYAILAPALSGLLSGDNFFSLSAATMNGKENLGIPRRVGSATLPLYAMFGKAGTALVTGACFIIVLKSYSSLGISVFEMAWVFLFSFLVSMTLVTVPGAGAFVALASMSALFGKGYEEGYLILRPVAPLLMSFAVFIDVVAASLISALIARHEGIQEDIEAREFV